jgi:hypothetical protein
MGEGQQTSKPDLPNGIRWAAHWQSKIDFGMILGRFAGSLLGSMRRPGTPYWRFYSSWAVLEDCQRNKAEIKKRWCYDVAKLEKIDQTPFWTVLRDLSWDQGEEPGSCHRGSR